MNTNNYRPRKGDRIRAIFEGDVRDMSSEFFNLDGVDLPIEHRALVSVEKIGPTLPTKSGSVIRWFGDRGGQHLLVLDDMGNWGNYEYAPLSGDLRNFEVIYDAGAKS